MPLNRLMAARAAGWCLAALAPSHALDFPIGRRRPTSKRLVYRAPIAAVLRSASVVEAPRYLRPPYLPARDHNWRGRLVKGSPGLIGI